ncbi:hypothetical protein E2C01_038473 [Portunus trituberculatus]|uniref:Uncharacterized protein n=1 Tax=Portunus trituberculatus TaxID=210409 RepID=A0A5B7FI31_PORTR|nr:hypothetical protein [Portunus trituberculatus]
MYFLRACCHYCPCLGAADADHDPNAATRCDYSNCTLPDCFCSRDGTLIPGNMEPSQVPQMITLTFDDAVNFENWNLYKQIFTETRTNPNGCPIHGTFYISHEYNNYQYRFLDDVRKLPDVWIVNNQEVIKWMREPTPNSQLASFEPWKCQQQVAPEDKACSIPKACKLKNRMLRGDRYLHTCFECPDVYPWLKNEFGLRL